MLYHFNPSNPGGYIVVRADLGVGKAVVFKTGAEVVQESQLTFCRCCGQRWFQDNPVHSIYPSHYRVTANWREVR